MYLNAVRGLPPAATAFAATATLTSAGLIEMLLLLVRLIEVLLPLLAHALLTLALKGCRLNAGAAAIRCSTGLVAVTAHGRAWPVRAECVRTIGISWRMLHSTVAPEQAVISVASPVGHIRPIAVIAVAREVAAVTVAIVVVSVTVVVIIVAVFIDGGFVDVSVVVVVDIAAPATSAPVHSPGAKAPAPAATEATRDKSAPAERCTDGHARAEGNAGRNRNRGCVSGHDQGRSVDHCRVVLRNVDHAAVSRLNHDGLCDSA